MANPLLIMLLQKAASSIVGQDSRNSEELAQQQEKRNATVVQNRQNRQVAQNEIQSAGRTGFAGIDAMAPATTRQFQIFNNVINRYRQQPTIGGGVQV